MPERQGAPGAIRIPFRAALERQPWRYHWFNAMRWFEAHNPSLPRFGTAARPSQEALRVSQQPSLQFAPATLSGFGFDRAGRPRIEQLGFGLFGPNGPLPLHITEHARARAELDKDDALRAFADMFHHRFALLFYRAWASAQAAASHDRPDDDRFGFYVASLAGYGEPGMRAADAVPSHAKLFMAGHLVRLTRNPEGLASILRAYFGCPFRVEEWVMNWLRLAPDDQTALGVRAETARLGVSAVCGAAVPDRRHRFRLHAGPLDLAAYERFLPGGAWHRVVRDWVRNYIGFELCWDLRLILRGDQIRPLALGGTARLGWTAWLSSNPGGHDRGELILDCERARRATGQDLTPPNSAPTMRSSCQQ